MRITKLPVICAIAAFSFSAFADDRRNNGNDNNSSLQSSVIGSVPGLTIGGILSGGAPWVVREGEASVSSSGRINVEVQGLLIGAGGPVNLVGTTGPVTMVGATLVCGGSGGSPVPVPGASVTPSPLSSTGNAEIQQVVTLPPACQGPVVLVRIFNASAPLGSQLGAFIAVTGLTPHAENQNNEGH
jgi:hypothetical protein